MNQQKRLLPSLNSYRGQHALLSLILTIILVAVAWVGYTYVRNVSTNSISNIEQRTLAMGSVLDFDKRLTDLQQWLQLQFISPTPANRDELQVKMRILDAAMNRVGSSEIIIDDQGLNKITFSLGKDLLQLQQESQVLIQVTSNQFARLPGTAIMQEQLRPLSEAIVTVLSTLAFEATQDADTVDPLLLSGIFELRHSWLNIVAEFRLFVANRFSVFSDLPEAGMEARMKDMFLYRQQFNDHLARLSTLTDLSDSMFFDETIWPEMKTNANSWFIAFEKLRESLTSDGWRKDLQLYRTTFLPTLSQMKSRISAMELELDAQASKDITNLTDIAGQLSRAIIYIALLGIGLVLFGYVYLKHRLILPIARTTEALKAEAQGIGGKTLPQSTLQETRNLVDAFREMREQVQIRQLSLDHMAHHDALTQLPNRVLFRDRLQHALRMAHRHEQKIGLMFMDLDRFKQVNDSLGHIAGDKLLVEVAQRLRHSVQDADTIARLSGDEFAILVEDIADSEAMAELGDDILCNLERTFVIQDNDIHISASIGIAIAPQDGNNADELIRDADTAMYEAKRRGKANYHFYSPAMVQQASERMQLEQHLREGLKRQEFEFHYQPIIDMKTGSPICFESLIRWVPEKAAIVPPDIFLPILMDSGLIAEVTQSMLGQIANAQKLILETLNIPVHFTLNIPGPILRSEAIFTAFLKTLCQSNIKRRQLTIEITEDTLIEDISNAEQFLAALKKENVKIALDDFGTGQSSLSHVRMFPFDIIKIDKEFVRDIRSDPNDASLVKVIIQLAHSFGMKVVAEGVEKPEQFEFLLHANCDMAQGYMVSKPMPLEQLIEYLRQQVTSLAVESY